MLALIGITGLLVEAARIALAGRPDFEVWSFLGFPLSYLFDVADAGDWHRFLWVTHVFSFVAFLVVLPLTKLRHMFTSPANMFLSAHDRPKGAMRPMPNLLEAEDIESIGVSVATDLTWKQIFDTDACTVCGRCTSVCPANITGKPLDPREMVLKSGEVAASLAGVAAPVSTTAVLEGAGSLFERIRPEEVFACTTCRACDEICPVDIEILDRILDMRRYLTLMESEFPAELGKAFVAMENQSNPWGLSQQARADWTSELDFDLPIFGQNGVDHRRVPVVRRMCRFVRRPQHRGLGGAGPADDTGRASTSPSSASGSCATAIRRAVRATNSSSNSWPCRTSPRSKSWG